MVTKKTVSHPNGNAGWVKAVVDFTSVFSHPNPTNDGLNNGIESEERKIDRLCFGNELPISRPRQHNHVCLQMHTRERGRLRPVHNMPLLRFVSSATHWRVPVHDSSSATVSQRTWAVLRLLLSHGPCNLIGQMLSSYQTIASE